MYDTRASVLNENRQPQFLPVPGRIDCERTALRDGTFAIEFDESVLRLPGRKTSDQCFAGILAREDVGDHAVLAQDATDQESRLSDPAGSPRHRDVSRPRESVTVEVEGNVSATAGFLARARRMLVSIATASRPLTACSPSIISIGV